MLRIVGIADGEYVHTHRWANYFAGKDHKVHLVSFTRLSDASRAALHPTITIDDWTVPAFHLKRFWITASAVMKLRRILRSVSPHLVHTHFLSSAAWYAALARRHPLVLSVMGGDLVGKAWRPRSRREQVMSRYTLRCTDLAVCWSTKLQRIVRPMLRSGVRCEVVVGGVDLRLFKPRTDGPSLRRTLGWSAEEFVIFSPRLFWPLYNIETIVRAFSLVLKHVPQTRLLLVKYLADKYPDYTRRVERLIDDLAIRSQLRLVPTIPNAEMPLYYSASDCVVSIPDTDGTPMTVMESAACGTPVVVRDLPDYDPNIFVSDQTVLKVPSGDPEGLAQAILRLRSDRHLRDRLRVNGERMAASFSDFKAEMGRLEQMYGDLVQGAHGVSS